MTAPIGSESRLSLKDLEPFEIDLHVAACAQFAEEEARRLAAIRDRADRLLSERFADMHLAPAPVEAEP